jgi:hypothetical protein
MKLTMINDIIIIIIINHYSVTYTGPRTNLETKALLLNT